MADTLDQVRGAQVRLSAADATSGAVAQAIAAVRQQCAAHSPGVTPTVSVIVVGTVPPRG